LKILFICGCLESGKDGVGDYTRVLARKLVEFDCVCTILSLNDTYVAHTSYENLEFENHVITVIRIPSTKRTKERYKIAKDYILKSKVDLISLQFVPYSYQKKGLPISLLLFIRWIKKQHVLHIMFHELWIGIGSKTSSTKNLIYSFLQRRIIMTIAKVLRPQLITTSINIYKQKLNLPKVTLLPLYGNIKIADSNIQKKNNNSNKFKIIHFGTFTSDTELFYNQIKWLKSLGQKNNKVLDFIICGAGGAGKQKSIDIIKQILGKECVIDKGVLSEREISLLFHESDFGVSRANFSLYGKSGTTMAMLEHGLPVLLKGERENYYCEERIVSKQLFFSNDMIDEIPSKKMPSSNLETVAKYYTQLIDL